MMARKLKKSGECGGVKKARFGTQYVSYSSSFQWRKSCRSSLDIQAGGRTELFSISSFQTSGFLNIIRHQIDAFREFRSIALTPFSRSQSKPPEKFFDSPTTTVPILNWRISPLQYQQGARVVARILSR